METVAHRPVTLELHTGERICGLLVHSTPERYCVRQGDTSLVVDEREVVRVTYEGAAEAAAELAADAPPPAGPVRLERARLDPGGRIAAVRAAIFAGPEALRTYLLLDGAAATEKVVAYLGARRAGHVCLYPDRLSRRQRATAPYLVPLEAGSKLDQRLVPGGWGQRWGVYLRAAAAPEQVAQHLRAFLQVADPRGEPLHFRFFDPRVLATFLETADEHEAATFFGGAWLRRGDGREDLACPLCDRPFPPLQAECPACGVALWARQESAAFLLAEVVLEGEDADALVRARPAPDSFERGARPPMRQGLQRGRKVLCLRREQLDALAEAYRRRRLARWALEHLQRAAPARCRELGPAATARAIRAGIARASGYGLVTGADVGRFLDVLFFSDLEVDLREGPEREVLTDPGQSPREKVDWLWQQVKDRAFDDGAFDDGAFDAEPAE